MSSSKLPTTRMRDSDKTACEGMGRRKRLFFDVLVSTFLRHSDLLIRHSFFHLTMSAAPAKWHSAVTRYQWLVLIVASLGWVFDAFEGQIFNITRKAMLAEILAQAPDSAGVKEWGDIVLGFFLVGGTLGGWLFGMLADRWGRSPTMIVTILFYSIFSGLTYFATDLWHVCTLRFLVAMGVGGEWAVAAALVAEVFPKEARARASGIFHSTSVLATWMAGITGMWVGANWRYGYLIGVIPALLTLWCGLPSRSRNVCKPRRSPWEIERAVFVSCSVIRRGGCVRFAA
jgi:MFS family permease